MECHLLNTVLPKLHKATKRPSFVALSLCINFLLNLCLTFWGQFNLPFYFTLSFFCCFKNASSLPGKRSTAGCFCLIKSKKPRIFGIFPKRKHCTIVSFVQCSYGWSSWIRTSGMTESKSVALPLGYTPIAFLLYQKSNNLSIKK